MSYVLSAYGVDSAPPTANRQALVPDMLTVVGQVLNKDNTLHADCRYGASIVTTGGQTNDSYMQAPPIPTSTSVAGVHTKTMKCNVDLTMNVKVDIISTPSFCGLRGRACSDSLPRASHLWNIF